MSLSSTDAFLVAAVGLLGFSLWLILVAYKLREELDRLDTKLTVEKIQNTRLVGRYQAMLQSAQAEIRALESKLLEREVQS